MTWLRRRALLPCEARSLHSREEEDLLGRRAGTEEDRASQQQRGLSCQSSHVYNAIGLGGASGTETTPVSGSACTYGCGRSEAIPNRKIKATLFESTTPT